ncbi:hypothetical protein QBC46DRAFT_382688 [Diplogelasinospora grovesii]|uniref:Uncharacterized protein n=1 Tax=Diplogelasinospora grovesii TaxID=303347 RepID=A0AAN6N919_9PEZI|nr:hypothetical protein QBC46DRAFT_382688 [Diplogelasinospora grovesii]
MASASPRAVSYAFPLHGVTDAQLMGLCKALWDWELCGHCSVAAESAATATKEYHNNENKPIQATTTSCCSCPRTQKIRFKRLQPFFQFYRSLTSSYVPDFFGEEYQALRNHQDLFDIVRLLRGYHGTRDECMQSYFGTHRKGNFIPIKRGDDGDDGDGGSQEEMEMDKICQSDKDRSFDLAARIMTMINFNPSLNRDNSLDSLDTIENNSPDVFSSRASRLLWPGNEPLPEALAGLFPERYHRSSMRHHHKLQQQEREAAIIGGDLLSAANLSRVAGLQFRGTSDLRSHLKLDQRAGVVYIFHYTSVLKEHLLASKEDREREVRGILNRTRRCLPRCLALETLYTLERLFPPHDSKSQALLRTLVSKQGFDPDCVRCHSGTAPYRCAEDDEDAEAVFEEDPRPSDGEGKLGQWYMNRLTAYKYSIWASRLLDLCDEIENPRPRRPLGAWLERRSKSRHVMMATVVGVGAAVVLGVLSLAVSIFQAWIAYQQWKNP